MCEFKKVGIDYHRYYFRVKKDWPLMPSNLKIGDSISEFVCYGENDKSIRWQLSASEFISDEEIKRYDEYFELVQELDIMNQPITYRAIMLEDGEDDVFVGYNSIYYRNQKINIDDINTIKSFFSEENFIGGKSKLYYKPKQIYVSLFSGIYISESDIDNILHNYYNSQFITII